MIEKISNWKMISPLTHSSTAQSTSPWLIRISKNFEHFSKDIIDDLGAKLTKRLGEEYFLIQCPDSDALNNSDASRYIRWKLSMDHAWPCNPEKMEDFLEKAAQGLFKKFGDHDFQGIFVGRLDPSSNRNHYKVLATNLRNRILELFPDDLKRLKDPEEQDPQRSSLFCLVGKEGIYCGISSPLQANGFYPGGTKFISQKAPHTISRAGAKIAEALHYLSLHESLPLPNAHWLELGASPGGMTSELLERGYRVTAIDRAPLDSRLKGHKKLKYTKADVTRYNPPPQAEFDAVLCDMNGDVQLSLSHVIRLSKFLQKGGLVVFTLKTPGATNYKETNALYHKAIASATAANLKLIACTHLTYNRHEFTLFFN